MQKNENIDFTFVASTPIENERISFGYEDMNSKYDFVLKDYESKINEKRALKLAIESDVVIIGSSKEIYITERMKYNKLTFRYSERINKRGIYTVLYPPKFLKVYKNNTKYKNKNLYMLCSSAYTSYDYGMFGAYKNKCYKWGYFPEVINCNVDKLIKEKPQKIKLLWCARFLGLKHPEKAIYIAKRLKEDGYDFTLSMLGNGELFEDIKEQIKDQNLEDCVNLIGAVPANEVRNYMDKANIFLFTSDFNEGWGAVLNEAMNSACAVVASHAIGSVPFLIENGENGAIYKNDSNEQLYSKVKQFMDSKELREKCGKKAYLTMQNTWNAEVATKNLLQLCDDLLANNDTSIKEGPCSKAEVLKNNWFKG